MCPRDPTLATLVSAPGGSLEAGETDVVTMVFPEGRPMGRGLELGLRVAEESQASLRVVRPVVLPPQTSLEVDNPKLLAPHHDAVDAVVETARGRGVEVAGSVRKGHDLAAIVVDEVREAGAGLVLAPGRPPLGEMGGISQAAVESMMDQIEGRVVVYGEPAAPTDCDRVGLAVAGGPHTSGMTAFATTLARAWGASVTLLHVLDPEEGEEEREEAQDVLDATAERLPADLAVDQEIVEDPDVIAAVLEEARPSDAWVMGAPTRSRWKHLLYGSRARRVQRDSPSWTFVVHEAEG